MSDAPPTDETIPTLFSNTTEASTKWRKVTLLSDLTPVDVLPDEISSIAVNGNTECLYKTLEKKLRLVISAVGTEFEDISEHVPAFNLLELTPPTDGHSVSIVDFWAVIYALHTILHKQETIPITISPKFGNAKELDDYLINSGLARRRHVYGPTPDDPELFLLRGTFWQGAGSLGWHDKSWLQGTCARYATVPFPHTQSFTRSTKIISSHPLRPPKPRPGELIYRRYCPQYGQSLELYHADLQEDKLGPDGVSPHLEAFHRWHNDPYVNRGWNEAGPIEKHRKYLKEMDADRGAIPVFMAWDGELMGYIELVYIKENHVSQYVPGGAWDYDRGYHVLVGEPKFRQDGRSTIWFASVLQVALLLDPRTERLIGEPKIANPGIMALSFDTDMHVQTVIDLPYKRSALTMHTREKFFHYDLLIRSEESTVPKVEASKKLLLGGKL
ncbi:hypothetical protein QCA50_013863 [Cerrena zonata]|uniref:Acyltransferase MbtK/IucB-like conserved domain-containing protein n=1 Tax=Cerrena zonata TaxID=2478898 RepID=A0AAW0FPH4_9APHY